MNLIIKNHIIEDNNWVVITDKDIEHIDQLPTGDLILPLKVWQQLHSQLNERNIGVWLDSSESPHAIKDVCLQLPIIGINFPIFSDGRGYSYAQILRTQYGYTGDLRAIGDVLKDQLFYMDRCGFSSFQMREDQKLDESMPRFNDFTVRYQRAIDKDTPLFRLR